MSFAVLDFGEIEGPVDVGQLSLWSNPILDEEY
jgi:hypothetical protein